MADSVFACCIMRLCICVLCYAPDKSRRFLCVRLISSARQEPQILVCETYLCPPDRRLKSLCVKLISVRQTGASNPCACNLSLSAREEHGHHFWKSSDLDDFCRGQSNVFSRKKLNRAQLPNRGVIRRHENQHDFWSCLLNF